MVHTYTEKDRNKQLSNNFAVGEFLCRCGCGRALVDDKLVERLQQIRDNFGEEVIITGPYRCEKHNKAVGGSAGSLHTKGMAADIVVNSVAPEEVAKYAESVGVKGIGLYEGKDGNFIHIDTRESKSFWYGHAQEPRATFGGAPKQTFSVELSTLQRGSNDNCVWALQALLRGFGYNLGNSGANKDGVDGSFGSKTEEALKKYQLENDLDPDGSCGRKTWSSLLGID
jgi:peptidoglycan hydrolase-like protein with peptidoglycan-binding domain